MTSIQSWKDFQREYNEPRYSKREMDEALESLRKVLRVNRVIQSFTGKVGPSESIAMQILAIHETPEGTLVIVR